MKSNRLIPTLSIISGILLALGGLYLIGLYVYTAVQSLGQPDQSLQFWYLPLVFFGILLNAAGAYFIGIGLKAFQNTALHKLSRNSLAVLIFVVILTFTFFLIGEYRADLTRENLKEQQKLISDIYKIENVHFEDLTVRGFNLHIDTSGSIPGEYQIEINFSDFRDKFFQFKDTVMLKSGETEMDTNFLFDDIFQICSNSSQPIQSYFCVNNAGTSKTELTISIRLIPSNIEGVEMPAASVESSWTTSLYLDTFTRNGTVEVESVDRNSPPF